MFLQQSEKILGLLQLLCFYMAHSVIKRQRDYRALVPLIKSIFAVRVIDVVYGLN